jgi:hypothetical protein
MIRNDPEDDNIYSWEKFCLKTEELWFFKQKCLTGLLAAIIRIAVTDCFGLTIDSAKVYSRSWILFYSQKPVNTVFPALAKPAISGVRTLQELARGRMPFDPGAVRQRLSFIFHISFGQRDILGFILFIVLGDPCESSDF